MHKTDLHVSLSKALSHFSFVIALLVQSCNFIKNKDHG